MHISKNLGFAAAILLLSISVGCSTRLDRHWGESQRDVVARQIAHPDRDEAETTIDGVDAEAAVAKHRSAETNVNAQPLAGVSGGSSGSSESY
jgi:hypothetical protein